MKIVCIILAGFFTYIPAFAHQALRVGYRLEAQSGGEKVQWSHQVAGGSGAGTKNLERESFLSDADFVSFRVKSLKSPPSKPHAFEVELVHSESGRKKFAEVANKDRERSYCVVIGNEIYQCLGFTPAVKGLWDKSTSLYGPFSHEQAKKLVSALEGL